MNAKREAARQFAKEQELEKLRRAKEIKEEAQTAKMDAMTPEEQSVYTKKRSRKKLILAAVAALIIIGAIAASAGGNKATPSVASATADTPTADAGAQLGCNHFWNVMSDAAGGLLTNSELRAKIKEVYDSADVSTNTGIAPAATAMLAAITAGDTNALIAADKDFGTACNDLGL